jgi:hypothetical protein
MTEDGGWKTDELAWFWFVFSKPNIEKCYFLAKSGIDFKLLIANVKNFNY